MLTLFKNSKITVGITLSFLPWMQVFCDIKGKDDKPEWMVNTIIVGRLDMTNSIIFGHEVEKATYFVFLFLRIAVLREVKEN